MHTHTYTHIYLYSYLQIEAIKVSLASSVTSQEPITDVDFFFSPDLVYIYIFFPAFIFGAVFNFHAIVKQ